MDWRSVPGRIRIRSAKTTDTLENVLRWSGVSNEMIKEMVPLNGGGLNQVKSFQRCTTEITPYFPEPCKVQDQSCTPRGAWQSVLG